MIRLRPATRDELEIFDALDREAHARDFVIQTGLDTHNENFDDPAIRYLAIIGKDGEFCGYFILVREANGISIEFRRILIARDRRGVGQAAIGEMERYCRNSFAARRIWLDVFDDNAIGIHVYEKLGYRRFGQGRHEGRKLLFYEKEL